MLRPRWGRVTDRPPAQAASITGESRADAFAWYAVVLLALVQLDAVADRILLSLVSPLLKASLAISDTQLGLLQGTGFALFYATAAIPLGRYADRGNRRNVIAAGILVWGAATCLCGLAETFTAMFLARLAVGVGQAALAPAALSLIACYAGPRRMGRAVSLFTTGSILGRSLALAGGGALLAILSVSGGPGELLRWATSSPAEPWRALLVVAGLPNLLLLPLLFTLREPQPARARTPPSTSAALVWIGRHRRRYVLHTIAAGTALLLTQGVAAWMPTFYVREFGMSPAESGVALGMALIVAGPIGQVLGGWVLDRLRRTGVSGGPTLVIGASLMLALPCLALVCLVGDSTMSIHAYAAASLAPNSH
jgi:MFS family permease